MRYERPKIERRAAIEGLLNGGSEIKSDTVG